MLVKYLDVSNYSSEFVFFCLFVLNLCYWKNWKLWRIAGFTVVTFKVQQTGLWTQVWSDRAWNLCIRLFLLLCEAYSIFNAFKFLQCVPSSIFSYHFVYLAGSYITIGQLAAVSTDHLQIELLGQYYRIFFLILQMMIFDIWWWNCSHLVFAQIWQFSNNPVHLLLEAENVYFLCARGFLPLKNPADSGWLEQ